MEQNKLIQEISNEQVGLKDDADSEDTENLEEEDEVNDLS